VIYGLVRFCEDEAMNTIQILDHNSWSRIQRHIFTCKQCHSHEILVVRLYRIAGEYMKILPCGCGKAPDGSAAVRSFAVEKTYEDHGYLDDDHNCDFIHKNKIIDRREIEHDFQINCGKCFLNDELDIHKWTTDLLKKELIEESVEFSVYCGGCGREMEFGWSHAERMGRIWPVECIDFDPQQVWPEPRFRENWVQKGWLGSDRMFMIFLRDNRFSTVLKRLRLKRSFQY
jgi:hypothetical protein